MLLTNILKNTARRFRNKPALIMQMGYRTVSLTYEQVLDLSLKMAEFLAQQRIKKGDKVLLMAPNSPYWGIVYYGCLLQGAVIVPLNTQSTPELLKKIAEQTEAKILIKPLHLSIIVPRGVRAHAIELLPEVLAKIEAQPMKKTTAKPSDMVQIMYTSGTTGSPKGVIHTHQNIISNIEALATLLQLPPSERFLSILPLSHIFEQVGGFLVPFYFGCTIVYAHSPAALLELMQEHRITIMVAVPEFLNVVMGKIEAKAKEQGKEKLFAKLLRFSRNIPIRSLRRLLFHSVHRRLGGSLHTVVSGGAPLNSELERKWEALGITLLQGYGLTETSPIVSTNTYRKHRLGSVGKVLPGVHVKITSDSEILVKGPNVFSGYYKNPEKTKASFTPDEWFKTDDLGSMDQDGYVSIKGRKTYMILGPGGQNVFPEDLEEELNRIQTIKASCVLGLPKEGGKVVIHAVLLVKPEVKNQKKAVERAIEEANTKLASYQQIQEWSLWLDEDFPRSLTRKVKKHEVSLVIQEQQKKKMLPKKTGAKTPLMHLLADITHTPLVQIRPESNLVRDLHLDSLLRVELVARIEDQFGVVIDEGKITSQTRVSDLTRLIKTAPREHKKLKYARWALQPWATFFRVLLQSLIAFPFLRLFVRLKIEGLEHLRDCPLPVIFMPNHISYIDSALIVRAVPFHIRKHLAIAAASDVLYREFIWVAWLVDLAFGSFPFPRKEGENIRGGLEIMGQLLDRKRSVMIFPEGRVNRLEKIGPLKNGTGLVAVEMHAPVVPVKILDPEGALPSHSLMPRKRGVVTVRFGKPLKFGRTMSYRDATEKITQALQRL